MLNACDVEYRSSLWVVQNEHMLILVVDDEPIFIDLFRSVLGGAPTLGALTLDAGLLLARHHQPDVVLLDNIFGKDERRGCSEIAAFLDAAPAASVIVMTAKVRPDEAARAFTAGAKAYVDKIDTARLFKIVDAAITLALNDSDLDLDQATRH